MIKFQGIFSKKVENNNNNKEELEKMSKKKNKPNKGEPKKMDKNTQEKVNIEENIKELTLEDISKDLESIKSKINNNYLNQNDSVVQEFKKNLNEIKNKVKEDKQNLSKSELTSELAKIKVDFSKKDLLTHSDLLTLKNSIKEDIKTELKAEFKTISSTINSLNSALANLNTSLKSLKTEIQNIKTDISGFKESIKRDLGEIIEVIENNHNIIKTDLEEIRDNSQTSTGSIRRLPNIEGNINKIFEKVEVLESKLSKNASKKEGSTKLPKEKAQIETLEDYLNKGLAHLVTCSKELIDKEAELTQLKKDNESFSETLQKTKEDTLSEANNNKEKELKETRKNTREEIIKDLNSTHPSLFKDIYTKFPEVKEIFSTNSLEVNQNNLSEFRAKIDGKIEERKYDIVFSGFELNGEILQKAQVKPNEAQEPQKDGK